MSSSEPNPTMFDYDDDKPQEFLVCYRGHRYILTEANETAAIKFRNASLKAARITMGDNAPNGARMEGGAEAQAVLVSGCLFQTLPDPAAPDHLKDKDGKGWKIKRDRNGRGIGVDYKDVVEMGSKIVKPLFEKAKEISALSEAPKAGSNGKPNTLTQHDDDATEGASSDTSNEGQESDDPKDRAASPTPSS